MIKILKYIFPPLLVAAVIFYLCCIIQSNDVPDVEWDFFISEDKVVHFLMYFGLSGVASFMYIYENKGRIIVLKLILFAILLPILYGGFIEILQDKYYPERSGDWFDFLADALGSLSVLPLALQVRRWYLNKQYIES